MDKGQGLRLNEGKIRYDLLEPFAVEQLAKVFTKGASKYEPNNWLKGMNWSKMRASLERHLRAWDQKEDFDFDPTCASCREGNCTNHTGLYHMAQVAWNAMCLVSYYKHFPEGDDRFVISPKRIGLDIDEVICNWVEPWCQKFNLCIPTSWNFEWNILDKFKQMNETGELAEFYAELPAKEGPEVLTFDPVCYITHRPVEEEVTKKWLEKHRFPLRPVLQVKNREDKLQVVIDQKLDIFVEDNYDTWLMLRKAGIACYLMDAKHNQRYDVGHWRIKSLKEIPV